MTPAELRDRAEDLARIHRTVEQIGLLIPDDSGHAEAAKARLFSAADDIARAKDLLKRHLGMA